MKYHLRWTNDIFFAFIKHCNFSYEIIIYIMKTWYQTLKYENVQNYTVFKNNHKTVVIIIYINDLKKTEKS